MFQIIFYLKLGSLILSGITYNGFQNNKTYWNSFKYSILRFKLTGLDSSNKIEKNQFLNSVAMNIKN